jgi:putative DNA primase/helicase
MTNVIDISTDSIEFNTTVSGTIISCAAAGVPTSLLIPIRPWDKPDRHGDGAGKSPAVPEPGFPDGTGKWMGLDDWEKGIPVGRLFTADRAGANCGLRLGVPSEREPRLNIFNVDIDFTPGSEAHRAAILAALQARCPTPMPWRSTWPYRGTVLLNVEGFDPGRDHNWLAQHNGTSIGKIQLLTNGRQCVIAGRHYSGNIITWHVNGDDHVWSCPPVQDVGLPTFASFDELRETLENCFQDLKALGYEFPLDSTGGAGTGEALADREKAPPELTTSIVVDALDRMPNPIEKARPFYEKVMQAIAGSRRGIIAWHGNLSTTEEERICTAAVGWVLKWHGWQDPERVAKHGNDPKKFETEKWNNDWKDKGGHYSTWWNLIEHARECGLRDLPDFAAEEAARASARAQETFAAEPAPVDALGNRIPPKAVTTYPAHYHLSEADGLYHVAKEKDEEGKETEKLTFLSAGFLIEGTAAAQAQDSHSLLISWMRVDGERHKAVVPKRLAHESGGALAALLEDQGLHCATGAMPHALLNAFMVSVQCDRRVLLVPHCGWHQTPDGVAFISPKGRPFGPGAQNVMLQHDHGLPAGAFAEAGTLAEWQDQIGRYAIGNSRVALCISIALAATLLDIVGEPSGGIHIWGDSQTGKTTAEVTGASTFGRGGPNGQIRPWRATTNGLEGIAAASSDMPLFLDEMGQADGRTVGDTVYALANEGGKQRASRNGSARAAYAWRTMMVSTGELTLAAKMADGGKRATAGLDVRLAEIPADAGKGLGVFEELHGFASAAALSVHLRRAAQIVYGTAGPAFLGRLVNDRASDEEALRDRLVRARDAFIRRYAPTGAAGQVVSVAGRFGLIAAAGELAIEYEVLPWPKGEALRSAQACFAAWLAQRGTSGASEDMRAIDRVREVIAMHGESRFTVIEKGMTVQDQDGKAMDTDQLDGKARTRDRLGFRRTGNDGINEFLFTREGWREVCAGLDPARVATLLLSNGWLVKGDGKNLPKRERVPGYAIARYYVVRGIILGEGE